MPTEVATLCFHTRDAAQREDGSFTFNVPGKLRNPALKVALASCEFPIVQQTIESRWNRLYYMETLRLTSDTNWIEVVANDAKFRLGVPSRTNEATLRCERKDSVVVTTQHPHHLFGGSGKPLGIFSKLILSSVSGDVDLDNIQYIDETSFRVLGNGLDVEKSGVVFSTCITSPSTLALLFTECAQQHRLPLTFKYEDATDRIVPTIGWSDNFKKIQIAPSPLALFCGFSVMPPLNNCISSEAGRWFNFIEIPVGFYGPCHRPMCVGQPLPLGPVMEMSLNRYYFPLLGGNGNGPSSHLFVFTSPNGSICTCTIPPGRYMKTALASHLEKGMTAAVEDEGDVQYSVHVTEDDSWTFNCERQVRNEWKEATFSIMFHHPMSVEPQRFGFSAQPMNGSSSYTSSNVLRTIDGARNLLRFGEEVPRKRFRAHAATVPTMIGVACGCKDNVIVFKTYVNKKIYSNGFLPGDAVRITSFSGAELEDGECSATAVSIRGVHTCIVEEYEDDVSEVALRVPATIASSLAVDRSSVQILSEIEPWCLHFGKKGSIPPHMVGWKRGGVIWGRDGGNTGFPPYEAPYIHNLDHPDYICMTFSEMGGMNFEHTFGGVTRPIFCKLSLYPLFREERMLPRDTQLMQGNMSSFTLSFWNPDMDTPYMFHGAEFSFSLAFFAAVPDPPQ